MTLPTPKPDWALFLDFDGTLAEIAPTPETVAVESSLPALLGRIDIALCGALAVVTGRPLAQVDQYLQPLALAGAGLHGVELRFSANGAVNGALAGQGEKPVMVALRRRLDAVAADWPGVRVEDKGQSLALHYRARPDAAWACRTAVREAADAAGGAFEVLEGKMVVELKPAGFDKGSAIHAFMTDPPFRGRVPVFAGDDVTDEAGFRAVNALGGHSIRVGGAGPTEAGHRVDDVGALLAWLVEVATALD
ncbi:trehalose-phosphatase [Oceanibacterium hippocampi]|uniref:Trehalose 6-phosphate phosphatase n=1 Tax=Oceanibacterium hippocampi TaxID=745714 RepID=A0A1Y5T9F6_9PROT|nr:trehalose-phosphatase [Oceanibacterium hippocampi]SLN58672.1 Trehalose-6-phosphate phosphatase [Oceanibacterium hippocampi]